MTEVTPLCLQAAKSDGDAYSPGDIAVDRAGQWLRRTPLGTWYTFGRTVTVADDEVHEPLTLLVRAGETTDLVQARQTATALEEQNKILRSEFQSQARQLANIAELLADACGDIEITFRRTDSLRGDT